MKLYTSVQQGRNSILVRGIDDNGNRVQTKDPFTPSIFFPTKDKSDWTDIHGAPVKRRHFKSVGAYNKFLKEHKDVLSFEYMGDIQPEYQYINDKFSDDIDWSREELCVLNFDIEVSSDEGFPDPEQATQPIISITFEHKNQYFVLGLQLMGKFETDREDVFYVSCASEEELLKKALDYWKTVAPDIITGWNIRFFDIPYMLNRVAAVLGENRMLEFSPWRRIGKRKKFTSFGQEKTVYDLVGISNLDYLDLYRNFTYTVRESYRLDHIAHVELKKKKVSFKEYETYRSFYRNDWQKFLEYNIQDVALVKELDEKMGFIDLAVTMAFDCRCNFEDVFMQVRMWDCLSYHYLLEKNIAVPKKSIHRKSEAYTGAYVKDPIRGFHDWVVSFDLNSLYPSLIRQYSIGPDTFIEPEDLPAELQHLVGKNHVESLLDETLDLSVLKRHKICMTANGQFFRNDKKGFLSELMEKLYAERKEYKRKALSAKKNLELVNQELRNREKSP